MILSAYCRPPGREPLSLEVGTKLAGYTIVGPLGAGGMGEVYRAMLKAYAPHFTHFNHYVHMGGSWGAKQSLGDPERISPKYKALREWAETHH